MHEQGIPLPAVIGFQDLKAFYSLNSKFDFDYT